MPQLVLPPLQILYQSIDCIAGQKMMVYAGTCSWVQIARYRCNRPGYTPGRSIPGYSMA